MTVRCMTEIMVSGTMKLWLLVAQHVLKRAEPRADHDFLVTYGGSMSQKDMWVNEVLEKRCSFDEGVSSMVGAKWRFQADIVNTSSLLFFLKCADQCERLIEVVDSSFCKMSTNVGAWRSIEGGIGGRATLERADQCFASLVIVSLVVALGAP